MQATGEKRERENERESITTTLCFLDCGQTKAELPIHRTATEERSR